MTVCSLSDNENIIFLTNQALLDSDIFRREALLQPLQVRTNDENDFHK